MDQVKTTLESIESNNSSDSLLYKLVFNTLTMINQEELCKKMPGVYYNFVCRQTDLTKELYEYNHDFGMNIMRNIGPILKSSPNIRNTIHKKISEGELHRKPYIKKANNNIKTKANINIKTRKANKIKKLKSSSQTYKNFLNGILISHGTQKPINPNTDDYYNNDYLRKTKNNINRQISDLNILNKNIDAQYNKVTSVNKNGKNKVSWVKKVNGGKC
jgi:hypothetical protein